MGLITGSYLEIDANDVAYQIIDGAILHVSKSVVIQESLIVTGSAIISGSIRISSQR